MACALVCRRLLLLATKKAAAKSTAKAASIIAAIDRWLQKETPKTFTAPAARRRARLSLFFGGRRGLWAPAKRREAITSLLLLFPGRRRRFVWLPTTCNVLGSATPRPTKPKPQIEEALAKKTTTQKRKGVHPHRHSSSQRQKDVRAGHARTGGGRALPSSQAFRQHGRALTTRRTHAASLKVFALPKNKKIVDVAGAKPKNQNNTARE